KLCESTQDLECSTQALLHISCRLITNAHTALITTLLAGTRTDDTLVVNRMNRMNGMNGMNGMACLVPPGSQITQGQGHDEMCIGFVLRVRFTTYKDINRMQETWMHPR